MATVIAVTAALGAACCFALAAVIQHGAARDTGEKLLSLRLLLALARNPRWLSGVALGVLSFAVQGLALAFGPLALVQPLAATDVLFALPMIAVLHRYRLTRGDWLGAGAVAGGIALFFAVSPPSEGARAPRAGRMGPGDPDRRGVRRRCRAGGDASPRRRPGGLARRRRGHHLRRPRRTDQGHRRPACRPWIRHTASVGAGLRAPVPQRWPLYRDGGTLCPTVAGVWPERCEYGHYDRSGAAVGPGAAAAGGCPRGRGGDPD